jgi:Flp pilus assembly protein TadD
MNVVIRAPAAWPSRPAPKRLAAAIVAALGLAGCGSDSTPMKYDPPPAAPLNGKLTLNVADTALAGDAPDLALHVTQSILAQNPNDVQALQRQGDAYFTLGQLTQAEDSYRRALTLRPGFAPAQLGLGRIALTRDPAAADDWFTKVLATDPRNTAALNDLAIARDMQGRHGEAQTAYRQALAIAPGDIPAQVNLGLSLAMSGNSAEAVTILRPLATSPSATPRIRHNYAVALALNGQTADAEQILRADMSPSDAATAVQSYRALASGG